MKKDVIWAAPLSAAILGFLFYLIYRDTGTSISPHWTSKLPALNSILNTCSAFCLLLAWRFIKRKEIKRHVIAICCALLFSALFLTSYLIYHAYHGDTPYLGQGPIRPLYFFILISHIVASMLALPMILLTLAQALRKNFTAHRKLARWTLPLWLYVSVTGVLVFIFIKLTQ